jgi:hypothetical protein
MARVEGQAERVVSKALLALRKRLREARQGGGYTVTVKQLEERNKQNPTLLPQSMTNLKLVVSPSALERIYR